jgi:transcriptional regulator with XRE-family HTH domain
VLRQYLFPYFFSVHNQMRDRIQSEVARLLKAERQKRDLSLTILAQRAGLSRQMVSYVEQEKRNPSLDVLLRITDSLDIKLEEVIRRSRKMAAGRTKS